MTGDLQFRIMEFIQNVISQSIFGLLASIIHQWKGKEMGQSLHYVALKSSVTEKSFDLLNEGLLSQSIT